MLLYWSHSIHCVQCLLWRFWRTFFELSLSMCFSWDLFAPHHCSESLCAPWTLLWGDLAATRSRGHIWTQGCLVSTLEFSKPRSLGGSASGCFRYLQIMQQWRDSDLGHDVFAGCWRQLCPAMGHCRSQAPISRSHAYDFCIRELHTHTLLTCQDATDVFNVMYGSV